MADEQILARALLAWYDRHRRRLPWRAEPGVTPDLYRVWLSEIMLQQTTVATVGPYYERFLARWPTVEALAAAPLEAVLAQWSGLGYYARARHLHACARLVVAQHAGRFPATRADLLALPGVGRYTAAAVAAIAFDEPVAAVDGNVERVMARLHAVLTPLPAAKEDLYRHAEALVPPARAGDHAQALMDLGATVCTPRRPRCALCPWQAHCRAHAEGLAEALPRRLPRKDRPLRQGIAFWLEREDGAVWLRRRPPKGLLGGLWEVPSSPWIEGAAPPRGSAAAALAPVPARWVETEGLVRHVFTHFELRLTVWRAPAGRALPAEGRFVAPAEWPGLALPTLMRKVVAHATHAARA